MAMTSAVNSILGAASDATTKATAYTGGAELGDWPSDGTYDLTLTAFEVNEGSHTHWLSQNDPKNFVKIPAVELVFWYRVLDSVAGGPDNSNMEGRTFGDSILVASTADVKGDEEQVKRTNRSINAQNARAKTTIGRILNIEIDQSWGITPELLEQVAAAATSDNLTIVRGEVKSRTYTKQKGAKAGESTTYRDLIVKDNVAAAN